MRSQARGVGVTARRRICGRAILCLALGLISTVGIAWTSAATQPPSPRTMHVVKFSFGDRTSGSGLGLVISGAAAERVALRISGPVPLSPEQAISTLNLPDAKTHFPRWWGRTLTIEELQLTPPSPVTFFVQDARGWPLLAVWCAWTEVGTSISPSEGGIDFGPCALPYRPLPFGLALDTLFFGALWSLILFAPGSLRRYVRRRRNLCTRCGYSLLDLPLNAACPECGHKPPHATRPT
jgi:hypothetical protein